MKEKFNKIGNESLLNGILIGLIGILFITLKGEIFSTLCVVLGVFIIGMGINSIFNYYRNRNLAIYSYTNFTGLVTVLFGILLIIYSSALDDVFRILFGIYILYRGVVRLAFSLRVSADLGHIGIVSNLSAIVTIICGIYIISFSGAITEIIGIVLIIYAISTIVQSVIYKRNANKIYEDSEGNLIIEEEE